MAAGLILTQIPPMRRAGTVMFISVAIYGVATVVFAFAAGLARDTQKWRAGATEASRPAMKTAPVPVGTEAAFRSN